MRTCSSLQFDRRRLHVVSSARVTPTAPASAELAQRLVLCRLMIDMMRTVHGAYTPASEPFSTRRNFLHRLMRDGWQY
jgi:hypothetical protein